jgi:hypothetical protein
MGKENVISGHGSLKKEDHEFKASLSYTVRPYVKQPSIERLVE